MFLTAGCMVGPDFVRPKADVPATFAEAPQHDVAAGAPARWWQAFGDPELDALVDRVGEAGLAVRERQALQRLIHNREQQLQAIAEDLGAEAGSH